MKKILFLSLFTLLGNWTFAQLIVDNTVTPEQAVLDILLGEGVDAFNITYSGDQNQIGSFDSSNSNILISDGMMMATGDCVVAIGPNNSGSQTTGGGNFGISDPDLDLLSTFNTNDAVVLEFDFIATGDSISFNYTFGSEEYNEYVCGSVNDAFGFFLSGPGITGPYSNDAVNLAIVPGTDIPVTINTVNLGVSGTAGTPSNCAQVSPDWDQNAEYYVDNETNSDPNSTQMDGFTVTLVASADVECGAQYHIKIAIADAGDTAFDSCVFLEAGSFSSNGQIAASVINAPPSLPALTLLEGCVDGVFSVFRPNLDAQDTVYLTIGGSATELEDFLDLPDFIVFDDNELTYDIPVTTIFDGLDESLENITLTYNYVNSCGDQDTVLAVLNILNYNLPELDFPNEVFLCNGANQTVSGIPDEGYAPFFYNWSTGANGSSISVSSDGPELISLNVIDYCENVVADSFLVRIPEPFVIEPDEEICLGASTSAVVFGGSTPYVFTYNTDSLSQNGSIFTPEFEGIYEVFVVDACGESGSFIIEANVCATSIPNVFSPNSDGKNDLFFITGLEGFPNSELLVFNRWGGLVFEDANYRNTWNAEGVSEGTYYYVLNRADGETFNGEVTILRK